MRNEKAAAAAAALEPPNVPLNQVSVHDFANRLHEIAIRADKMTFISQNYEIFVQFVKFLRHGPIDNDARDQDVVWYPLQSIADLLRLPLRLINQVLQDQPRSIVLAVYDKGTKWRLEENHLRFLAHEDTLMKWRPYSLLARTRLFNIAFPDKFLCISRLRQIYRQAKIKQRSLRAVPVLTES